MTIFNKLIKWVMMYMLQVGLPPRPPQMHNGTGQGAELELVTVEFKMEKTRQHLSGALKRK